jgi:uncharacterized protein with ParB-like and HNH nuclease domain
MSVLNIFRRNGYVFVGENERFNKDVHAGDYFAIADGRKVVAVARALEEPTPLSDLIASKKLRFRPHIDKCDFNTPEEFKGRPYYGVRVHLLDLPPKDYFIYWKMGTFYAANMHWNHIKELYHTYADRAHFDIASKTYRLKNAKGLSDNDGYNKEELLDGKTYYVVPVYQREYSWDEKQITRFIRDIFSGYWSVNEERTEAIIKKEPLFIGTMQLSQKRFLSPKENEQDIIDGQQRTSTLLCLFKYISLKYPEQFFSFSIPMNWLETRVNNEKEQTFLEEFLKLSSLEDIKESSNNKYIRNCALIGNSFEEATEHKLRESFDVKDFISYLLTSVYFVAVETVAGLSKTIQIFNTINTGGLDLNGDDLFKVRFYEYLRPTEGDQAFNDIGEVYKRIKDINARWREGGNDYNVVSMSTVRTVYKDYIISKYDMPNGLFQMGTDTFYEYLFDDLLGIQHHNEIGNRDKIATVVLSLTEINLVVDVVSQWNQSYYQTPEELIAYKLIEKSRYSRFTRIAYLLLMNNFTLPEVYSVLLPLAKVYLCYSIYFSRTIYDIHNFSYNLQKRIGSGSTISELKDYIIAKLFNDECISKKEGFKGQIAYNRIWKDLMCCLSVYFDEVSSSDVKKIDRLITLNYDVEHIHATEDTSVVVPSELQNSIGNLVLLESSINRSIGNQPFIVKKKSYERSEYQSIKKLLAFSEWGVAEIKDRLENQYQQIVTFIWGGIK